MNNQTAVEFLIEEIETLITIKTFQKWMAIKEQAKEIDKQNIKDAYLTGLICPIVMDATKQAEEYYLETFKKD